MLDRFRGRPGLPNYRVCLLCSVIFLCVIAVTADSALQRIKGLTLWTFGRMDRSIHMMKETHTNSQPLGLMDISSWRAVEAV